MNKDDKVENFKQLLRLRTLFKAVSQLSWNINQLERRYPVDALTDDEVNSLKDAYAGYTDELKAIVDDLGDEIDDKKP